MEEASEKSEGQSEEVTEEESKEVVEDAEPTVYMQLEMDYQNAMEQLGKNPALVHLAADFTKLYDAAVEAHTNEEQLTEKCQDLEAEIVANALKVINSLKQNEMDKDTIIDLKAEIEKAWKMMDTAHGREETAHEIIDNLRQQVGKFKKDIEQRERLASLDQSDEFGGGAKSKAGFAKEREVLMTEIMSLRDRLSKALGQQEELERKKSASELEIEDLTQKLQSQTNDTEKEMRAKERLEFEIKEMDGKVDAKETEIAYLTTELKTCNNTNDKLEITIKEQTTSSDRLKRKLEDLVAERTKLQADYDMELSKGSSLQETNKELLLESKNKTVEASKLAAALLKSERVVEQHKKKLVLMLTQYSELQMEEDKLKQTLVQFQTELNIGKRQLDAERRANDNMLREKEILNSSVTRAKNTVMTQSKLLALQEQVKKTLQADVLTNIAEVMRQTKIANGFEKEKDRCLAEMVELTQRIAELLDEVKLMQAANFDNKRKIAEMETQARQQLNLYEAVRTDRNTLSKNLVEAQEEISELKQKMKVIGHQVEQLKEDISTKESQQMKLEFVLQKMEKERESLKGDLGNSQMECKNLRATIREMQAEEKKLQKLLKEAEKDISRQTLDIEQIMNERDILGTQLVRRNDELCLLHEKVKVMKGTLDKGEAMYNQRLSDIQLLRLEIKTLRGENAVLTRSVNNTVDMRQEILNLERDLTKQKLKTRALEQELETPLNVHRWRKLQGADPNTLELIQKVQLLQKRLLAQSSISIERDKKLHESQLIYLNLQEQLTRLPGPELVQELHNTQTCLRDREKKLKCVTAELNMLESQVAEYKFDLDRVQKELQQFKKKFYEQKRREHRLKSRLPPLEAQKSPQPQSSTATDNSKAAWGGRGAQPSISLPAMRTATCI